LVWALAVLKGVEQEKDRKARENPKIAPKRTRLKIKKFLDDKRWEKFIQIHSSLVYYTI
jgi:hypothetical protein